MKTNIYLGIGSNIGNKIRNIIAAIFFLKKTKLIYIKKMSAFYETSPIGPRQANFYNTVIEISTNLLPYDLLSLIKQIEYILGRRKAPKWYPRVIDIDILFFGSEIINISGIYNTIYKNSHKANLIIPHKEILNRLFVLVPLQEIAKDFVHPILKQKLSKILSKKLISLKYQKIKIVSS
ncbi:MAG: 2-amino-4-hydroxy-6-hydroxymethyldihydropteridine diphosphokinase [Endomicrobium sp.]|jgi:2-amino-4-hydroxy-6-hydroxymethyldihydropteridine diphosphokinase|nr:2-amino-4-hydroxy-6-hydroxymethyldihydropteridine diphosphokinase [Endomicrobium sp.]